MQKVRIIVHNDRYDVLVDRLKELEADVDVIGCGSYAALPDLLTKFRPDIVYGVRFAGSVGYPVAALTGPAGPRWLAVGGSGTDHLGVWDTARLTVTNSAGVAADMMAEYVFGSFLHFSLDVAGLERDRVGRVWQPRMMMPLAGKRLLIIGLGQTGLAIARRASAFGLIVHGVRARPQPTANVDKVHAVADLPECLDGVDLVAVCAPLLDTTRGLVDAAALARLNPGAVLADVSRGGIVDHEAVRAHLAVGRLRGAALDVFPTEPLPEDSSLWSTPNLLISPHCSSVYEGWELRSIDLFAANLSRWRAGLPLDNVVDPHRGY